MVPPGKQPLGGVRSGLSGRRCPNAVLCALRGQHGILLRPEQRKDPVFDEHPHGPGRPDYLSGLPSVRSDCAAQRAREPVRPPHQDLEPNDRRIPWGSCVSQSRSLHAKARPAPPPAQARSRRAHRHQRYNDGQSRSQSQPDENDQSIHIPHELDRQQGQQAQVFRANGRVVPARHVQHKHQRRHHQREEHKRDTNRRLLAVHPLQLLRSQAPRQVPLPGQGQRCSVPRRFPRHQGEAGILLVDWRHEWIGLVWNDWFCQNRCDPDTSSTRVKAQSALSNQRTERLWSFAWNATRRN
mmetsp:Transcript_17025/g.46745  ORF Transcript_17025/g.46745 Transcript_17025/m.46745 type:complete len:297 (-) Transcript_17025:622-1512(-)